MRRNKFTPTTAILILVLLGAIYKVGTVVSPPPAKPPEPPPPPVTSSAPGKPNPTPNGPMDPKNVEARMKQEMQHQKDQAERTALETSLNHGKPLAKDDISPAYFQSAPMGAAGLAKADEDVADAKRIKAAVDAHMAAEHHNAPPPADTSGTMLPTPGQSTPKLIPSAQPPPGK